MIIKFSPELILSLQSKYTTKAPEILWGVIQKEIDFFHPTSLVFDEITITEQLVEESLKGKTRNRAEKATLATILIHFFNDVAKKKFKHTATNVSLIVALLDDGYTEEEIKTVIINKTDQWAGSEHLEHFLRPSTLFRKSNFDNYINEPISKKAGEKKLSEHLDALLGS